MKIISRYSLVIVFLFIPLLLCCYVTSPVLSAENASSTISSAGSISYTGVANLVFSTDFESVVRKDSTDFWMYNQSNNYQLDLYGMMSSPNIQIEGSEIVTSGFTPHSGTKCIYMEYAGAEPNRNEIWINNVRALVGGDDYYVSEWMYLPANWTTAGSAIGSQAYYAICDPFGQQDPLPSSRNGNYDPYVEIHIHGNGTSSNPFGIVIFYRDENQTADNPQGAPWWTTSSGQLSPTFAYTYPNFPLPRGRWFNIAWYVHRSDTNGYVALWMDGIKVGETPHTLHLIIESTSGDYKTIIGKIYQTYALQKYLWVDDFSLYSGMPY